MTHMRTPIERLTWLLVLLALGLTRAFADFTFVQVSDTHVNADAKGAAYNARYEEVVRRVNALKPAFVMHTGDALEYYSKQNADLFLKISKKLTPKFYVVPGNHDVGNKPGLSGQITGQKNGAWIDAVGYDRVSFEHEGCVFIGLNAALFNSGLPGEKAQWDWLTSKLEGAKGKRVFVFQHYPVFESKPDEESGGYNNIDEPARSKLLRLLKEHEVEAVLSGHLHRLNESHFDGISFVTTPATSFSCARDKGLTGCRVFRVTPGGVTTQFVDLREAGEPPDFRVKGEG